MKYPLHNPLYDYRPMHSRDMLVQLGVTKLPKEGMPERLIHGIRVWVVPHVPVMGLERWSNKPKLVKSSKHRVMCACPGCGQTVPAGRLFQHKCKPLPNVKESAK